MTQQTKAATTRALMALVTDLANLTEAATRVRVQVAALAAQHGVAVPEPCPSI